MKVIKNKTYRNFLIVKKRIIFEKHYEDAEASKLTHQVFANFELDKGNGNNSIEFFIDRILTKEEFEEQNERSKTNEYI